MMIGEIMSIDRQTAFTTYTINDGTGSVLVKKFADRDATNMNMAVMHSPHDTITSSHSLE